MEFQQDCSTPGAAANRREFLKRGAAIAGGSAFGASLIGSGALVQPARAATVEVILSNTSNPAISPNLTTGDSYTYSVLGPANAAVQVCTSINGGSWSCASRGQTNQQGSATFTGQAGLVGTYAQTWYVGGQQAPLSFRVYPWNTSISKSVMQNVSASAAAVYRACSSGGPAGSEAIGNCANPYQTFFDHIDDLGLTPSFVNTIQNYYASNGIPTYNSTLQSQLAQWASQMGWSSLLSQDFFRLESLAQIALSQIQPLNTQAQWDSLGGNYTNILNWISSYVNAGQSMSPALGGPNLAQKNAETGAAVGGALIGGGSGLVLASSVVADLGIAAATGFTLCTGGVGLIVIGVAVAGYYGWQWMNSNVSNPGPADQVSNGSLYPPPNPN